MCALSVSGIDGSEIPVRCLKGVGNDFISKGKEKETERRMCEESGEGQGIGRIQRHLGEQEHQ